MVVTIQELTYEERLKSLRETKQAQTRQKQDVVGAMDYDDWALILPPEDRRKLVETISPSGLPINDVLLTEVNIVPTHDNGGFYGPKAVGANFRRLLEAHPVYIDPVASLAGGYMVNYSSYHKGGWNPDLPYDHLKDVHKKYKLHPGIGAKQHFCQDDAIGLELGFGGLLEKVRKYRDINTHNPDFYDGLEDVVLGLQNWVSRAAEKAREMAASEDNPQLRQNLEEIAEMNEWLIENPPRTFREACQWMVWYQMAARMYNGSGSLGRLDVLLTPYYERDIEAGILTDDEAIFHIACLILRDTAYLQLGGPDAEGYDVTNHVSYLVLEAAHRLKVPANVGVSVGDSVDSGLLKRGVEIMFEDKLGIPKFLGVENTARDFAKSGYSVELGRQRAYSGCHWSGIPGHEYTLNDCVKINMAVVFDVALRDMMANEDDPSVDLLWDYFSRHLEAGVDGIAQSLDFHLENMPNNFPELVLDLCCYGPVERGYDASFGGSPRNNIPGGVDYYSLCCDAAGLATVADSFAALEQRIDKEGRMTWDELMKHIDSDWEGPEGERARLMMKNIQRYGHGGSRADAWAVKVSDLFTHLVADEKTPRGFTMIPGLFSWANTIGFGKDVGATPNGRKAHAPISHGASPDPGFRKDGAPTAMAVAVAAVQPGYGNTAPMQIDMDPGISKDEGGVENVMSLIKTHFDLGGTQINMNVMNAEKVLEAHEDPGKYPDLVVRVTGFSAYFASLSPQFRQLVVDRIIAEGK